MGPDSQVYTFLKSQHINCSVEWLAENINYFKSCKPNISAKELNRAIYNKFLSTNLRDLRNSSLPANIVSHENVMLNGMYVVQVESIIDSSESCYTELRRLRDSRNNSNEKEKPTNNEIVPKNARRCLTFLLCDGVQEVQAMEYHFIPTFSTAMLPGFKILLKGPILCRKGMLLLKEENMKYYGGKVDSLCAKNYFESLLLSRLNLNPDDSTCHEKAVEVSSINCYNNTYFPMESSNMISNSTPQVSIPKHPTETENLLSDNDDILLNLTMEAFTCENEFSRNVGPVQHSYAVTKNQETSTDNFFLGNYNESINAGMSLRLPEKTPREEQQCTSKNKRFKHDEYSFVSSPGIYDRQDDIMVFPKTFSLYGNGNSNAEIETEIKSNIMLKDHKGMKCTQMKISSYLIDSKNENNSEIAKKPCATFVNDSVKVNSSPYVYLEQVAKTVFNKPNRYTVKGIILTLKSKISIKNDVFSLRASITDGSYTIQVNFSSQILEEILEYSPCEIAQMMHDKSKNCIIDEKLKLIFYSAQQKLLSMNCLMVIDSFNDGSIPLVSEVEEVQSYHLIALKARKCQR